MDNYLNPSLRIGFEEFAKKEGALSRPPCDLLSWNGLDYSDPTTCLLFRAYCQGRLDERDLQGQPTQNPTLPRWGIRVGEPEILGSRCADGGVCHHESCDEKCYRQETGCLPLTGSGLNDDWSIPLDAR